MTQDLKTMAAQAALDHVEDGMTLGIGTGSTAERFVIALAARVREGLAVIGVPTSERTRALCEREGIPLSTLEARPRLDVTIDGADEVDGHLRLIKGGGGALLREKVVACASRRMIVVADDTKLVETLGAFPLPIEVVGFGLEATRQAVRDICEAEGMRGELVLRADGSVRADGSGVYRTDEGHVILDATFGRIERPEQLAARLASVPGVVEHGLFLDIATLALVATKDGVREITAPTLAS